MGDLASATAAAIAPLDVLAFWCAAGSDKWFTQDPAFDAEIAARFGAIWRAAADGKLAHWEATPEGALALVIVLGRFPRNMFRGNARSYEADAIARAVADRALKRASTSRSPRRSAGSSIYRSCIRNIPPIRNGAWSWRAPMATTNS
jgi:uncharacterized protein (DUF924 family)